MKNYFIILFFAISTNLFAQSNDILGTWELSYHTLGGKNYGNEATLVFSENNTYRKVGINALGLPYTETGTWKINNGGKIMMKIETISNEYTNSNEYWVFTLDNNTLTFDYLLFEDGEIERFDMPGGEMKIKYFKD